MSKLFPTILIALMGISGAVCAWEGDYRKMLYWWAAVVLNASVTW